MFVWDDDITRVYKLNDIIVVSILVKSNTTLAEEENMHV